LPRLRIERTKIVGKIVLDEDPGAADLSAGDLAYLGAATELLRMATEEVSRLSKT
jgi:hypothetical protein